MKFPELAKRYRELEAKHIVQSDVLKEIGDEWSAIEAKMLESMVDEGVNQIRLPGIGLFSLSTRNFLSVTVANKEKYIEYLENTGNDGLLKVDVNPKTNGAFLDKHLAQLIQEKIDSGECDNVVEGRKKVLEFLNQHGVSYFSERKISVRKA